MTHSSNNFLALDVGEKRIGVAFASAIAKLPRPLAVVANTNTSVQDILRIAKEEAAGKIVVGLPLNRHGDSTQQTEFTKSFIEQLMSVTELPIDIFIC